jgi:HEAT repeat protein
MMAGGKPIHHWIELLQQGDAPARKQAAFKLGNVGAADAAAFPVLMLALEDRDINVRCEVIRALLKAGPSARDALPKLVHMTRHDPSAQVRGYAARAAEKIQTLR